MFWRILKESFFRERKRKALAVATVRDNAVRVIDRAPTRLGGAGF